MSLELSHGKPWVCRHHCQQIHCHLIQTHPWKRRIVGVEAYCYYGNDSLCPFQWILLDSVIHFLWEDRHTLTIMKTVVRAPTMVYTYCTTASFIITCVCAKQCMHCTCISYHIHRCVEYCGDYELDNNNSTTKLMSVYSTCTFTASRGNFTPILWRFVTNWENVILALPCWG